MANQPYVKNDNLIDPYERKPYELIHERFFINVPASTGWKPSTDSLFNYYLDITLDVQQEELDSSGKVIVEADEPITLAYSPFVTIPDNVNRTCAPSNFPYARTIAQNTVRLYAYKIPSPIDMSPITITLKAVNTSEGATNGNYNPSASDITIEKNIIQVRGTSFLTSIDENNYTTEEIIVEMFISGFRGVDKREINFGNFESIDLFYNMGGTKIDIDTGENEANPIIIETIEPALEDGKSVIFKATIPAGVYLKDKMAYFNIPIEMGGQNFWARSTIYTNKTPGKVSKKYRYKIKFPTLTRSTGGTYYANGKIVPPTGFVIKATRSDVNGTISDASGELVIKGVPEKEATIPPSVLPYTKLISGEHTIETVSMFNDYDEIDISLIVDGEEVYQEILTIETNKQDIIVLPREDYVMSAIVDSEFLLPDFSVDLFSLGKSGFLQTYYGVIVIFDENDKVLATTKSASGLLASANTLLLPSNTYTGNNLPSQFNIRVYDSSETSLGFVVGEIPESIHEEEILASKIVSVVREGTPDSPYEITVTPSNILITTNRDGIMESPSYTFQVKVLQGSEDVSENWVYEVSEEGSSVVTLEQSSSGYQNTFSITGFTGDDSVVILTARANNGSEELIRDIVINRIKREDNNFFIEGHDIIRSFITENNNEENNLVLQPNPLVLTVTGSGGTSPVGVEWQYKKEVTIGGERFITWASFYEEGTEEFANQQASITINLDSSYFNRDQVMSIRAKVDTALISQFDKYTPTKEIRLLEANVSRYTTKIVSRMSNSGDSHVFPIDRYGNAIRGTTETGDPLELTLKAYRGLEELKYRDTESWNLLEDKTGFYTITNDRSINCMISKIQLGDSLSILFNRINGTSGVVSLNLTLEGRETVNVRYKWSTNKEENVETRYLNISAQNNRYTINTASYIDIVNSDITGTKYLTAFIEENEQNPMKIHFYPYSTNIETIAISSNGFDYIDLKTNLKYKNGESNPIIPLNILEPVTRKADGKSGDRDRQIGFVLPNQYYLISFFGTILDTKVTFTNLNGSLESFLVDETFLFNGAPSIIIKAMPGAEKIDITLDDEAAAEMLRVEMLPELLEEIDELNHFESGELNLSKLALDFSTYANYLPLSYERETLGYFTYKRDSWETREYLEISPAAAVNANFFASQPADVSSTIRAKSLTGEESLYSIFREVRPYKDFDEFSSTINEILSGDYLDNSGLLTLKQSRESLREKSNEIIGLIDPESMDNRSNIVEILPDPPQEANFEIFYNKENKVEDGQEIEVYPLNIDSDSSAFLPTDEQGQQIFEGLNLNSIFGLNIFDDSYHYLEFYIKYEKDGVGDAKMANFTFRNVPRTVNTPQSVSEFSVETELNTWKKHSILIPPAGVYLTEPEQFILDYLTTYELTESTDNLRLLFQESPRKTSRNKHTPFYMYLNFLEKINKETEGLFLKNLRVYELSPGRLKEINIYNELKYSDEYEDFITKTNNYINKIDQLENEFDYDTGRLEMSDYSDLYNAFVAAEKAVSEIEYQITLTTHADAENTTFKLEARSRSYAMGFSNSTGWLSSLRISPDGVVIQGEKNRIIGSTSIGSLYGKKIVIGKNPTKDDYTYDKELLEAGGHSDGIIAVWDDATGSWASVMNKKGQYFLRYDTQDNAFGLVGYMVMNPQEIAAYQFDKVLSGFDSSNPIDVEESILVENKYSVFKISHDGNVIINNLSVRRSPNSIAATVDLMETIRVQKYSSIEDGKVRSGVVFIGISGGGN